MQPQASSDRVRLRITVSPSHPHSSQSSQPNIPEKLLRLMRKYKYNWRIDQLSRPKLRTRKFVGQPDILPLKRRDIAINEKTKFFADHMSRPKLKDLYENKRLHGHRKHLAAKIEKNIDKSWNSMYNFYKRKERDRRARQSKRTIEKPKVEVNWKRLDDLARPKLVVQPQPLKRKTSKRFSNYDRLDDLAAPKRYLIVSPKSFEVSPAALVYEPTENILRLAKVPSRLLHLPEPLIPGSVKRSALQYKITPRIEEIAVPKRRSEKIKVDEDFDPWAIPKNALTYHPTPRILELARPIERD
ncbi:uncharacterized protein LOC132706130 [Cylas formicarius]|uniref:uncharacterized protein LOC132706130 n=1 Tax=Cylas formicarius TaxID=197179 RepID=UPI00295876A1|nr:uncharacterized protein LOC132706130 [Cylas formicarius]